jgi:hypothetical protein
VKKNDFFLHAVFSSIMGCFWLKNVMVLLGLREIHY